VTKKASVPILAGNYDLGAITRFVELLNMTDYRNPTLPEVRGTPGSDYRAIQKELRALVQAWLKSGPNVAKLLDANPALSHALTKESALFVPTKGYTARLAFLKPPEYHHDARPLDIAFGLFRDFLLNVENNRLGGPCKKCGNYYVRTTERKTVYCSKLCSHRFTSRQANRIKRGREHKKQLKLVKRSIRLWRTAKTTKSWKEWITGEQLTIKKMWLTLAIKKGEIKEPFKTRGRPRNTRRASGSPHRR
jgi:hypothetical protein